MTKIFVCLAIMGLLASGGALASWILSSNATITGAVTSDGESLLVFEVSTADMGVIDTSLGDVSVNETLSLVNGNGLIQAEVSFLVNVTDNETDGCDNTGDLSSSLTIDGNSVIDGDVINITSGTHPVVLDIDLASHSCPATFVSNIAIVEV